MNASAPNPTAIVFFLGFVALTLVITWWAARRTKSADQFYAAGRSISGVQNGFALAGDFMSASSLLGVAGMVALSGLDGLVYAAGAICGWPVVLVLFAESFRNLGKYTFADVVSYRLKQAPVRVAAAISTMAVIISYLIAQMVGAGNLIRLMFGLPYEFALAIVAAVMLIYVLFGGMLATTWVQILKAVLLLGGCVVMCILVLSDFGMSPPALFAAAAEKYGARALHAGPMMNSTWDALSLSCALMFGLAGMPHILMRFYTVPDAKAARLSAAWATVLIGAFYLMVFILGMGALVIVGREGIVAADKGGNMAVLLLAQTLGGTPLLGFIAAVGFATILAVVAGLTLSGAAAFSHDIWISVIRKEKASYREQLLVARIATIAIGIVATLLGIAFKGQNIAFMVTMTFGIAASGNFPAIALATFWRRATTMGMVASMIVGTVSAVVLIYGSSTIQIDILGNASAWFPLSSPALITMPLAFVVGIVVSLLKPEPAAAAAFEAKERQMILGAAE